MSDVWNLILENKINLTEQFIAEYGDEITLGELLSELRENLISE